MSKENIVANKAAEEGGLPLWHHNEYDKSMHPDPCGEWYKASDVQAFIAADRASRQVANKAEVEPVAWAFSEGLQRLSKVREGFADSPLLVVHAEGKGDYSVPLYDTPPATTGASTTSAGFALRSRVAGLLHLLEFAEISTPSKGDAEQAKKAMRDVRRMLNEDPFGSKMVGASTVLTDERISQILDLARLNTDSHCEALPNDPSKEYSDAYFFRQIQRWVAAQAGQVAVQDLMRQAVATVVSRAGDNLRIGWLRPERCDVGTLLYCAAPSPAKESK